MNLTIDREVLLNNLNTISRGLATKSPNPILTGIKIYVTDTDLFMTSSNSDISVEVDIADSSLIITEAGQTVVPGKFFIDIIRKINSKTVNLYSTEDQIIVIKADRGEYKLHVMDPLDYPEINLVTLENPLTIDAEIFLSLIKATVFAASTSEKSSTYLQGVNLKHVDNELIATATDSYRLGQKKISIDDYQDFNIIVPAKSLDELSKAIESGVDEISLYFSKEKLLVKYNNVCFQTRLISGDYPDTSRLIPTQFLNIVKFNKDELIEAIERVSLLSPRDKEKDRQTSYSIIKLSIEYDGSVEISTTNAFVGDAKEELIPTGVEITSPVSINVSSRYLLESLRSLTSTEISLNLNGSFRQFIIKGDKDYNITQLLLPVRAAE